MAFTRTLNLLNKYLLIMFFRKTLELKQILEFYSAWHLLTILLVKDKGRSPNENLTAYI